MPPPAITQLQDEKQARVEKRAVELTMQEKDPCTARCGSLVPSSSLSCTYLWFRRKEGRERDGGCALCYVVRKEKGVHIAQGASVEGRAIHGTPKIACTVCTLQL